MTGAELLGDIIGELGDLQADMVFTGGIVLPLYFERQPYLRVRPTKDVDAVVAATSLSQYAEIQAKLGRRGFTHVLDDADASMCRMRTPQGNLLDVMPIDEAVLGFEKRWFERGYMSAQIVPLGSDVTLRVFPAPVYMAAKVEAYRNRGKEDLWASSDLEDILTLLECRPSLLTEVSAQDEELRTFLAAFASEILEFDDPEELINAYLRSNTDDVIARLENLARQGAP